MNADLEISLCPPSSKHILNAQVSIRAPCCKGWFDCPECHAESQTHELARTTVTNAPEGRLLIGYDYDSK